MVDIPDLCLAEPPEAAAEALPEDDDLDGALDRLAGKADETAERWRLASVPGPDRCDLAAWWRVPAGWQPVDRARLHIERSDAIELGIWWRELVQIVVYPRAVTVRSGTDFGPPFWYPWKALRGRVATGDRCTILSLARPDPPVRVCVAVPIGIGPEPTSP
jgi:hypothetical protein